MKIGIARTLALVTALAIACVGVARAEAFPSRPVRVIVPNAPGGGLDVVMRVVQNRVGELLEQPLIFDYRPGGSTLIGTKALAASAPDGYTLAAIEPAFLVNPALSSHANYDPLKDFTPVSLLTVTPLFLAVPASHPAKTLAEFVEYAKKNPTKFNYGSPGTGSAGHLAIEQFNHFFGLKGVHVPYKGSAPGMIALAGGEISALMAGSAVIPLVQDGRLRALAVTGSKRSESAPNVPTFAELGYPTINVQAFVAVVAPAGTPTPVVKKLETAFITATRSDTAKTMYQERGQVPVGSTSAELAVFFKDNTASLTKIVRDLSLKLE